MTVDATGKTKPYIFRACFIDPFQGTVGAKFAIENLKAKTAFIMLDQANDYVKGLAEFFEQAFVKQQGGTIVGKESYTANDTDFSAILAKVRTAKPDVVYLPDYYNIVNLATKQAKEKGIPAPFMGGDGWDSSDLDLKAAAGGYFTNHYSPVDPRPEVQNFVKAYGAKFKDDRRQRQGPGRPGHPGLRRHQPAAAGHQGGRRRRHRPRSRTPWPRSSSTASPARSPSTPSTTRSSRPPSWR